MKAQDKSLLFNLFKTASAHLNGYTTPLFEKDMVFTDDEPEKQNIADIEQTANFEPAENEEKDNPSVITAEKTDFSVPTDAKNFNPVSDSVSDNGQIEVPQNEEVKNSKSLSISDLNSKILRCTRCQLARTRNNVVPGMGVENPDVMVVGEGPGYDEDMQGLPFVGKAGALLDKMLLAINLDRKTNCYIANVVKCRPPKNRDPMPEEQSACWSFLEAQIHILKPKMILCMGRIAGQKLLKTEESLGNLRGKINYYNNIPLMVTYHPSALLRNAELKRPAWEDLKAFRRELDRIKQS